MKKKSTFSDGFKAGIPIALGYIPIAIAFGLLAKSAGIPDYISVMMSFFIFAGASQFVGVNLITLGAIHWEIIITTFILNSRHFLMSASISRRIEQNRSKKYLPVLAFGITDETFTVASLRKEPKLSPKFILGLNLIAFSAWNIGTWIGIFLAADLPEILKVSMGIALYAMFIGLLIPALKKSHPALLISFIAIGVHSLLHWVSLFEGLSSGVSIIIATIIAASAGAVIFPKGVSKNG